MMDEVEVIGQKPNRIFGVDVVNRFRAAGIDTGGVDLESATVDTLKARGIAMVNVVGGATETIVHQVGPKDLSRQLFLSQAELEEARREFTNGLKSTPEEVSLAAARVLMEIQDALSLSSMLNPEKSPTGNAGYVNFAKEALRFFGRRLPEGTELKGVGERVNGTLKQLREEVPTVDVVRGQSIGNVSLRAEGTLKIDTCPIVGCGHKFSPDMGVVINDRDGRITGSQGTKVRLNSIDVHMYGHGLSNAKVVQDPQQRHMTLQEFDNAFSHEPSVENRFDREELLMRVGRGLLEEFLGKERNLKDHHRRESFIRAKLMYDKQAERELYV